MFLVIFILGIFVYEKYSDMLTHKQVLEISASQYNSSDKTNHTKVTDIFVYQLLIKRLLKMIISSETIWSIAVPAQILSFAS